eukprot:12614797-Ditylum_brightwellii.AAC.1
MALDTLGGSLQQTQNIDRRQRPSSQKRVSYGITMSRDLLRDCPISRPATLPHMQEHDHFYYCNNSTFINAYNMIRPMIPSLINTPWSTMILT